jgi:hypothetical protein
MAEPINGMINNSVDGNMLDHVMSLNSMQLPSMFLTYTINNSSYRDAILNRLIDSPAYSLQLMLVGVRSSKNDTDNLRIFSEYAAALSYVTGDTELAGEIILRNNPSKSSTLLTSIAESLSIGTSPDTFKELLRNSTAQAAQLLANA